MMRAADGIAEGDVEQTITVKNRDELGAMAQAFDRMLVYLREQAEVAERVASGDLTVMPQVRSERDLLGTAMQRLVVDLERVVGDVTASAGTVASASQQMASTSDGGRPRRHRDRFGGRRRRPGRRAPGPDDRDRARHRAGDHARRPRVVGRGRRGRGRRR